ncbi:phosphoglycerate kinase [Buchnera aphidicola (Neophyllaphis varicolor)]|uniref:phosphoglycerate kinase n=1 Tax=Buchnera aphidicola TaxID=9 RepID=UPI0031B85E4F
MIKITDLNINNKRVLIRSDLNVPIKNKRIKSYARIEASLPTIKYALSKNSQVILLSHLGRPIEGKYDENLSLKIISLYLKKILKNIEIIFIKDLPEKIEFKKKTLIVLENVRFNIGEKSNSSELAKKYANLCDVFVMDAFGCIHRSHASTHSLAKQAKKTCAGLLLTQELKYLKKALINPIRPMVSIVGGAKISTKFGILDKLLKISDYVIVGGGIANTFLAINNNIGKSLHESKFIDKARILKQKYNNLILPHDSKVVSEFNENADFITKKVFNISNNEEIIDFGNDSAIKMAKIIKQAKTIIWNGPVGVFEFKKFREGTEIIAKAIAKNKGLSIAGGGDTLAAIEMFKIKNKLSYISTGGGAFLKLIEGNTLPIIEELEKRSTF